MRQDSDQQQLDRAVEALAAAHPALDKAVSTFGMPTSRRKPAGFATLARIVVDQQISTAAGASIWNRLTASLGTVNAGRIAQADETALRTAGLSGSKVKTLKALAEAVQQRRISLRGLESLQDDDIKDALTSVWGIGTWTAEIYLMFGMGRPDVWPAGDLALRTGWQCVSGGRVRIGADGLARKARAWSPHRSAAAILLWHCVHQAKLRKSA